MSEKLGPRVFGHDHGQPFLGLERSRAARHSHEIDDEIGYLLDIAMERATEILLEHRDKLDSLSELLLERETIEAEEFEARLEDTPVVAAGRGR
jgi:cell division protease FtsH